MTGCSGVEQGAAWPSWPGPDYYGTEVAAYGTKVAAYGTKVTTSGTEVTAVAVEPSAKVAARMSVQPGRGSAA
jgi:hypothetical protein